MNTMLSEIQQPGSPLYDHFLTDAEVGQMFGPSPSTLSMVQAYFGSYGLTVTPSSDGLSVSMHGPTEDVAAAFHTSISMFTLEYRSSGIWDPGFGDGSAKAGSISTLPYYANSLPIFIPQTIADMVSGVVGLDAARATPDIALPAGLSPASLLAGDINPHATGGCALGLIGTCLTEEQAFNDSYGNFTWVGTSSTDPFCIDYDICNIGDYQFLMPQTLPALVGAHALWDGSGTIGNLPDTGQGITVAVVETGCMDPQTLQNFSLQLWGNRDQVTSRFTQIALPGIDSSTGHYGRQTTLSECIANATATGWETETALDIEYMAAMAPSAHIDLVGLPYDSFDDFDQAYQFITSYLSTGAPCPASFGATGANFVGVANDTGACSVSIDSNSYGSGEATIAFDAVPIYLDAENQLLNVMSMEGITNFFASGDYGGGVYTNYGYQVVQAGMPAIASGAVSVGGGQLTAMAPNGHAFESTGYYVPMCEEWEMGSCLENLTLNVTTTSGIDSFTYWAYNPYWSYGSEYTIYDGLEGAGHGASETLATPWWENANDTYTSGVKIDPVISNAAAFNMTVWAPDGAEEGWEPTYGGTSFACPITAGEWALVEEQAQASGVVSRFGDINALLFALHNAGEASVPYAATGPFYPMGTYHGRGFTSADWDSFNWYSYNLSMVQGTGTNLPPWAFDVINPAGPLWNFLGGLGIVLPQHVIASVIGTTHAAPSVLDSHMSVVEISGSNHIPVTELAQGTSYNLAVVNSTTGAMIPNIDVWAYSGGANSGTYGGGTTTFITSSNGTFTYTPKYASNEMNANYTEYAYFKAAVTPVGPSNQWAFNAYAVVPSKPVGSLTLDVMTPYGVVSSGAAEITSFTQVDLASDYTEGSTARVLLNGLPAPGAVVTETSVNWNWSLSSESQGTNITSSAWAPGTLVSDWISDTGGQVTYFTNGFSAEHNGTIPPQVFQLQATDDGLTSAPVTVYVEPQFGLFEPDISMNPTDTAITGNVSFEDMKYLSWLNVSFGGGPGQFENYSCSNDASFCNSQTTPQGQESTLMSGTLPISLTLLAVTSFPPAITLSLTASGNNVLYACPTSTTCGQIETKPLWSLPLALPVKGPAPVASLTPTPTGLVVSGTVNLTYGSTWTRGSVKLNGANGTLAETWPGGGTVLVSGMNLVNNGTFTYAWNTTSTPSGYVKMTMIVSAPDGLTSNASVTFYVAKPMITLSPSSPQAGQSATFTAWSEGGSGVTYSWNFGDGATSALPQPVHAYSGAGTYHVKVTVNDSSGLSVNETTSVTVTPSSSSTSSALSGTNWWMWLAIAAIAALVVAAVVVVLLLRKRKGTAGMVQPPQYSSQEAQSAPTSGPFIGQTPPQEGPPSYGSPPPPPPFGPAT
jgi:subtilase family serine protease